MTTEIKAQEKAEQLVDYFSEIIVLGDGNDVINSAIFLCDETIKALNSVKGMGKISKVKFWKLVKENLEKY